MKKAKNKMQLFIGLLEFCFRACDLSQCISDDCMYVCIFLCFPLFYVFAGC